jgi:hypothetical protein
MKFYLHATPCSGLILRPLVFPGERDLPGVP